MAKNRETYGRTVRVGRSASAIWGTLSQLQMLQYFQSMNIYRSAWYFFNSSEQLKQRFSFLQLKYGELYTVLDAAKVCTCLP